MSDVSSSIDPTTCRVWSGQPRSAALTPDSCADLIAGIRAQGQQEIPAIVRALPEGDTHAYEIICGARRHFAVTHLRADGGAYDFLVSPRTLSDEQAFRLADLENRSRVDISTYDRACAYAAALNTHYGGVQKDMARQLNVGAPWLARYLQIARLPTRIVACFADPAEIRVNHARRIKRLLNDADHMPLLLEAAQAIRDDRATGKRIGAATVLRRLEDALPDRPTRTSPAKQTFRRSTHDRVITMQKRGPMTTLTFPSDMSPGALRGAFDSYLRRTFPDRTWR